MKALAAGVLSVALPLSAGAAPRALKTQAIHQLPASVAMQAASARPSIAYLPPALATTSHMTPGVARGLEDLNRRIIASGQSAEAQATLEDFWARSASRSDTLIQDRLAQIVETARASATGRGVIARIERLAKRHGPTPVTFLPLKENLGEFDYVSGVVRLDRRYRTGELREAAAVLIHELLHVLQHAQGIPTVALERELEAHPLTLQVAGELGLPRSFMRGTTHRLKQGAAVFAGWMAARMPSKIRLERRNFDVLAEQLEDQVEEEEELLERLFKRQQLQPRNLKLDARIASHQKTLAWTQHDLDILRSPEGRRRYARFADRVEALLERQTALQRRPGRKIQGLKK